MFVLYDDYEFWQQHSKLLIYSIIILLWKWQIIRTANFVLHLRMVFSTCQLHSSIVWVCALWFNFQVYPSREIQFNGS